VTPPIAVVAAYMAQHGWRALEWGDGATLVVPIDLPNGRVRCLANVTHQRFLFHSFYPFTAPTAKRMLVAEFVVRANYHIADSVDGVLDFDLSDGEIGFKTRVTCEGSAPSPTLVATVVRAHLDMADRLLPGVAAVCFTDIMPRAAVEQCVRINSLAAVAARANQLLEAE
jgi:hypothetical protein